VAWAQASSSRFLDLLDEHDRAAIGGVARSQRYARGSWIMRQGDPSDSVCIVLEGRAKVTLDTADGRTVVLDIFGPGDVLGEFEALGDDPTRAASIVALDPIDSLVITRKAFRDYLLAHPAASLALVRSTIRRLDAADRRRIDRTAADASHALARFLVELSYRGGPADGGGVEVDVPLAQHELASLIGVSRNSMVRALTSLRSLGLIATTRPTVRIVDVASLRRYARAPPSASSRGMAGDSK
jgi:CRP-like cAMP-binding protein